MHYKLSQSLVGNVRGSDYYGHLDYSEYDYKRDAVMYHEYPPGPGSQPVNAWIAKVGINILKHQER